MAADRGLYHGHRTALLAGFWRSIAKEEIENALDLCFVKQRSRQRRNVKVTRCIQSENEILQVSLWYMKLFQRFQSTLWFVFVAGGVGAMCREQSLIVWIRWFHWGNRDFSCLFRKVYFPSAKTCCRDQRLLRLRRRRPRASRRPPPQPFTVITPRRRLRPPQDRRRRRNLIKVR